MKCLYATHRKDVSTWTDEYLELIYDTQEKWRATGVLAKTGTARGHTARSFAIIVRNERRKRLGT